MVKSYTQGLGLRQEGKAKPPSGEGKGKFCKILASFLISAYPLIQRNPLATP